MKGRISLSDFISEVKKELREAEEKAKQDDAYFQLTEVNLEASFVLEVEASAGIKLWLDVGAKTKAGQQHKVVLKLKPLDDDQTDDSNQKRKRRTGKPAAIKRLNKRA